MSLVHLVCDSAHSNEGETRSALPHTDIMKGTCYMNTRWTQCRDVQEQRVHTGVPSVRLDWRCTICKGWYGNYRGCNIIHLQHCKRECARQIVCEERIGQAQTPLPSLDYFTPNSTPDLTPIPQSPPREPLLTGDTQGDQYVEDTFFEPPLLDEALDGDENPGKPSVVLLQFNHIVSRHVTCDIILRVRWDGSR